MDKDVVNTVMCTVWQTVCIPVGDRIDSQHQGRVCILGKYTMYVAFILDKTTGTVKVVLGHWVICPREFSQGIRSLGVCPRELS